LSSPRKLLEFEKEVRVPAQMARETSKVADRPTLKPIMPGLSRRRSD